ncbi:hypothetical protein [Pseudobythopirellula maris]|nr:hypothetical protein [Pseudobythopirellula maris]
MPAACVTTETPAPLSPAQELEVTLAHDRAKKIRKAAAVARFNGWTIGLFAALSAPFALFSMPGFVLTVGMAAVAYNEFAGRRRLLRFDESAPRFLGWNQVAFLGLIVVYSCWMLLAGLSAESPFAAELRDRPELREVFDSFEGFDQVYHLALVALYGTVIVMSAVFQGANACYYFAQKKRVVEYLRATPAWVLGLQRLTPGQ